MVSPPMVKSVKKKASKSAFERDGKMQLPATIMDRKEPSSSAVGLKIKKEALKIKS
jgi:hypothetical protein